MSPAVPPAPPPGYTTNPGGTTAAVEPDEEIRVYGHNNLFYWWPVWLLGFVLAGLTYADGHVMALVPPGTQVEHGQVGADGKARDVLVTPAGQPVPSQPLAAEGVQQPKLWVAANNNYGVAFVGAILLVIVITNFIFRGLISVLVIAGIAVVGLLLALLGWWDDVLAFMGGLDVRMNAGGYLAIAIPLFLIWLFSTFVYDHYVYLVVTRGQVRIRKDIGDAELAVDTNGLLLTKERDDLFRHWLLGLGSGDLHVKTGNPSNLDFELNNVLFIGSKLARIQELLREKEVTTAAPPAPAPA